MPKTAFGKIDPGVALGYIQSYFAVLESERPKYTGSFFERFGGSGDEVDPNRITTTDLVAVSMLGVDVPAQAAIGIIDPFADHISDLLIQLPVDRDLHELSREDFNKLLNDEDSPGHQLWNALRQHRDNWGVGATRASKIMARKRPRLIPIYDSIIKKETGLENSGGYWERWHDALHGDGNAEFLEDLRRLRDKSGQSHLSLLRVLDIVLWQNGRRPGDQTETVGDKDE